VRAYRNPPAAVAAGGFFMVSVVGLMSIKINMDAEWLFEFMSMNVKKPMHLPAHRLNSSCDR
jgi:hypothetical protein